MTMNNMFSLQHLLLTQRDAFLFAFAGCLLTSPSHTWIETSFLHLVECLPCTLYLFVKVKCTLFVFVKVRYFVVGTSGCGCPNHRIINPWSMLARCRKGVFLCYHKELFYKYAGLLFHCPPSVSVPKRKHPRSQPQSFGRMQWKKHSVCVLFLEINVGQSMLQIKEWILCADKPLMYENKANINIILAGIWTNFNKIQFPI